MCCPGVWQIFSLNPGQVKPKTIKLVFGPFPLSTQHKEHRAKTGWIGIWIIWLSGGTCLSVNYCFCELALLKSNLACWSSTNLDFNIRGNIIFWKESLRNSHQFHQYQQNEQSPLMLFFFFLIELTVVCFIYIFSQFLTVTKIYF